MQGLEEIPDLLAIAWDISLESAQMLLSIVVILAIILPTMYLSRGNSGFAIELVMLFLAEVLLVGIGWFPSWVLIATIAVMAIAIAMLGTRVVVGE